jgi:hypothetical protein
MMMGCLSWKARQRVSAAYVKVCSDVGPATGDLQGEFGCEKVLVLHRFCWRLYADGAGQMGND